MKKIGIYKIENVVNKKYYIGSSNDINRRWNEHKSAKVKASYIQRAIKKHGIQDFYFEIMEECAEKDLLKIEQQYLDIAFLIPHMIYNTNPLAACPPNRKGKKFSAEHCAKLSAALKGLKLSAEHCAKISAAKKGKKQPNISAAKKGKKQPNISAAKKCKTIHSFRNINTGETYTGILYDFCDKYSMVQSKSNIVKMLKGRVNIVKGWVLV